jgi:hypothetical protein
MEAQRSYEYWIIQHRQAPKTEEPHIRFNVTVMDTVDVTDTFQLASASKWRQRYCQLKLRDAWINLVYLY